MGWCVARTRGVVPRHSRRMARRDPPTTDNVLRSFTAQGLFSGIGALEHALSPCVSWIAYCESDPFCVDVLRGARASLESGRVRG